MVFLPSAALASSLVNCFDARQQLHYLWLSVCSTYPKLNLPILSLKAPIKCDFQPRNSAAAARPRRHNHSSISSATTSPPPLLILRVPYSVGQYTTPTTTRGTVVLTLDGRRSCARSHLVISFHLLVDSLLNPSYLNWMIRFLRYKLSYRCSIPITMSLASLGIQ